MSGSRLPLICCDASKPGQPDDLSKSTQWAAENCVMRDLIIAIQPQPLSKTDERKPLTFNDSFLAWRFQAAISQRVFNL